MPLLQRVYSVLLVSDSERFHTAAGELLPAAQYQPVRRAASVSEAKRMLAESSFDFVIINAPLPDDSGTRFAIDCCHSASTVVLLLVKTDAHPAVREKVAEHGVFTLPKPTSRATLLLALGWLASARERLRRLEKKTLSIDERMEEIRIVNRAKLLLISELRMSEAEAHRYIEKTAMDDCIPKREAAQRIIRLYT